VRAYVVEIGKPIGRCRADFEKICEDVLIEELVSNSGIEALNTPVLHRLSGIDEVQLDITL